ncbi:hypothetical protein SAMN05216368_12714 [Cryobacterium flavum]|uniref:Uncharacterized protein n=1 Tax=Cryobacterium flavum TaxID=1424659 RepID=A0A5E9G430_9MICO|nr:hypothetical protein SAMN05216368_12714 [Cryobacterium flavum]
MNIDVDPIDPGAPSLPPTISVDITAYLGKTQGS